MSKLTAVLALAGALVTHELSATPAVVISEFMAINNSSTLADEDGDYSDWVEVYETL